MRMSNCTGTTNTVKLHKEGSAKDSEGQTSEVKCGMVGTGDKKGKIICEEGLIKIADAYLVLCLEKA